MELAEEWSRLALDHLPVGILIINRHRKVRIFNQTLSRFLGLEREKILGQPLLETLDDRVPENNLLLKTLATGKEFQNMKPQTVVTVSCSVACLVNTLPVRNKTGITVGAMALFSPAARLQEMENAVIKAEKLAILGQLAAGMVHEIRNPLTAIGGFLQLMQKHLQGSPREEYIPIMLAELNHANRLISEFLQFARPGFTKRGKCSINDIIKDLVLLVESEALSRQIEIETALDNSTPKIIGDSGQLKQVFINIIKNAFDALSPGGKILIKTKTLWNESENFVQISINDTGAGVDEEVIKNMFNPFFTTKENGTGLGMFTSKKIIDNHKGRIKIKSEPGKGTTVNVLLPVEQQLLTIAGTSM